MSLPGSSGVWHSRQYQVRERSLQARCWLREYNPPLSLVGSFMSPTYLFQSATNFAYSSGEVEPLGELVDEALELEEDELLLGEF